jgi:hypothetical protein
MEKATASVKKRCPHCDAKMVEYRHVFNKGLAHGLYELFSAGGGPVAWGTSMTEDDDDIQEYKKPWVGLTDEELFRRLCRLL